MNTARAQLPNTQHNAVASFCFKRFEIILRLLFFSSLLAASAVLCILCSHHGNAEAAPSTAMALNKKAKNNAKKASAERRENAAGAEMHALFHYYSLHTHSLVRLSEVSGDSGCLARMSLVVRLISFSLSPSLCFNSPFFSFCSDSSTIFLICVDALPPSLFGVVWIPKERHKRTSCCSTSVCIEMTIYFRAKFSLWPLTRRKCAHCKLDAAMNLATQFSCTAFTRIKLWF